MVFEPVDFSPKSLSILSRHPEKTIKFFSEVDIYEFKP